MRSKVQSNQIESFWAFIEVLKLIGYRDVLIRSEKRCHIEPGTDYNSTTSPLDTRHGCDGFMDDDAGVNWPFTGQLEGNSIQNRTPTLLYPYCYGDHSSAVL